MQNVGFAVRVVLSTLCLTELAAVLVRLRHRDARREAAWLAALLASFAARLLVPRGTIADVLAPAAALAATGGLLLALNRRPGAAAWAAIVAIAAAALIVAELVFHPFADVRILRAAAFGVLSLPPFALLVLLWRKTGEPADFLLLTIAAGWGISTAVELAGGFAAGTSDWFLAPLLMMLGFMVFEEGYLSPLTSSGYIDRLAGQRRLMRETYARLLASEDALLVQDRLIAAGLLALGASHEFKNVLASLRVTAEHGLAQVGSEAKDRSLRLLLEHAEAGGASAAALLERLGREGREEPRKLEVRDLVERLGRIARPAWRPAGIALTVACGDDLAVTARRPEIEQVLLNLLRNAADAFAERKTEPRSVRITAHRIADRAVIEVSDNAGGIAPSETEELFSLGRSGKGSTGIGLYLARHLAERNGGSLSYQPIQDGSCFCLQLPRAGVSEAGPADDAASGTG